MKKFLLSVLAACFILTPATSFAAQGRATIPFFLGANHTSNGYTTTFFIGNVTAETITVKIKLFDKSGNLLQDDNTVATSGLFRGYNVSSFTKGPGLTDYSMTMTVAANATGYIEIKHKADNISEYGHGFIEWTQDSDAVNGLVCTGEYYTYTKTSDARSAAFFIPVNGCEPF